MAFVYPELSVTPQVSTWKEQKAADPTIRTPLEAGYVQTRPRHTRVPKKWEFQYAAGNALPLADKVTLESFETAVGVGGAMFGWTNPVDGVSYDVRFAQPIEFAPQGNAMLWSAKVIVEQV